MKAWLSAIALLFAAPAAAQPQDISRPGWVAHPAAHAGFPEQVGDFRRAHVLRYGENDLSGNYDLRRGADFLRLSVYIYPAPRVPASERASVCSEIMAAIGNEISRTRSQAERVEAGDAPALPETEAGLRLRSVHRVRMALRSREEEAVRRESRLYCYVAGDWLVKYYASSNADFDVEDAIERFIRDGPWPNRGPASIALR